MSTLSLSIDSDNLMQALLRAPDLLARNLSRAVNLSASKIARSARSHAPKATTLLTQSIRHTQVSRYEAVIAAGVDYARFVEQGRDPGVMPPVQPILDWIQTGAGVQPQDDISEEDLAFLIARSISQRGIKPQPFMQPALEDNRAQAERNINRAIDAALQGRAV